LAGVLSLCTSARRQRVRPAGMGWWPTASHLSALNWASGSWLWNQHPDALRGRTRWQGSHWCRTTRYLSQLTMLVSRVAAPPVLSRDLHSRIRCVSRVTSAHRFAAIAGRRPTTRRPGLPGSTRSHRSRREALQLESLPFPAV